MMKHNLWKSFLDLLYPPKCVFCRKLLTSEETHICNSCQADLPRATLSLPIPNKGTCHAPLAYEGAVKAAILRYKFGGASRYAEFFSELMVPAALQQTGDVITWIPVSHRRKLERGYDQAELLAEALAKRISVPCVKTLQKKHTKRQSATGGRAERKANVAGAFSLCPKADITGKSILLIDDICTTGATLSEAIRVLKQGGAASVQCLTLAITQENTSKG